MKYSPRVKWIVRNVRGKRILDIGFAGESDPLVHREIRSANPASLVVGVDIEPRVIRRHGFANTLAGNAFHLPLRDGSFDAVALLEVIEHVYDAYSIIEEARRVLEPGGRLYLTTPNTYHWARFILNWLLPSDVCRRENYRRYLGDTDHKLFLEPLSLMNMLADHGFKVISLTTKNHRIPLISRFAKMFDLVDLNFYPMDLLGGYICLVARAV